MSWKRGLQGSSKSSFELWIQTRTSYREKPEWGRDWLVARTTSEKVTTWNVMPLGSQWPNRHQNITDRRETKAKLNHSPPTEWAVWHEVGLHLLGIKSDTQKTQEPVRQQLVTHKIQLHVGQGKGLPRNQTPKHNCYPSTSLTMLLNRNNLLKLWPFNIFEGRIWFKLFLIYKTRNLRTSEPLTASRMLFWVSPGWFHSHAPT